MIFSRSRQPPPALDQAETAIHLVGSVDSHINAVGLLDGDERDARLARDFLGLARGGDTLDGEVASGAAPPQRLDEESGGRARTQANNHAAFDIVQSGFGGSGLLALGAH